MASNTEKCGELFIENEYARSEVLEVGLVQKKGLRCYRNSPSDLIVQLRTATDKQGRMTNIHLEKFEAVKLANHLLAIAEELS
jgi:hypothetical protein